MKEWLKKFDNISETVIEELKATPSRFFQNKRLVLKSVLSIALILIMLNIALKLLVSSLKEVVSFVLYYKEPLLAIAIVSLMIFSYIANMLSDSQKKKQETKNERLKKERAQAHSNYNYLKNFLYRILYDPHFCELTELLRPLTINNINENPPYEINEKTCIALFHFRADKRSVEPLEKGVDNIVNLLQSVITNKVETLGIEGICPPARDNLKSVIAVHEVVDCGSYVRITLVFDNDAYREAMQSQQISVRPFLPEDRYIR